MTFTNILPLITVWLQVRVLPGRLGRERVCALKKGAIEVPTDFAGVGYVDMDASGAWKKDVLRELEHAGYKNLDWQKSLA